MTKTIANSVSPKLDSYKQDIKMLAKNVLEIFLNNFYSKDHNIMGEVTIRKVKQLKKVSDLFFTPIRALVGVSYP